MAGPTISERDLRADSSWGIDQVATQPRLLQPATAAAIAAYTEGCKTGDLILDTTSNQVNVCVTGSSESFSPVTKRLTFSQAGAATIAGDFAKGGIIGATLTGDLTQTEAAAAYALTYDDSAAAGSKYQTLAASNTSDAYAADWQLLPDSEEANKDFCAFGAATPFCEIYFNVSATNQTYAADAGKWQYYGAAGWTDLTGLYDYTDATAQDGKRSFGRDGSLCFVPPADWTTTALGNTGSTTTAYWVRWLCTAAQISQIGLLDAHEHYVVTVKEGAGYKMPFTCNIDTVIIRNRNATVNSNVPKMFLMNFTKGTYSKELTWTASSGNLVATGTDLKAASAGVACDAGDLVALVLSAPGTDTTNKVLADVELYVS